ncbi:hypothetical protein AVEN_266408-1 [Araneus ventricosus]|uniref:DUF7041 domain-containing protein n=1 Tax=Araneus ventricosus TaxID=182803 RepID=A0A4Y2JX89_ARAVE|nr:hypothetical protein AVEN_266408-1 [Araneus ventricosus]
MMYADGTQVTCIALRLPPFWRSTVQLWVVQCFNALSFSGIVNNDTKYSDLVAETLSCVSDIVINPPSSEEYTTLCQRLISEFGDSNTQKAKKLLTELQFGDEKPSHLLRKMKELSNGQVTDGFLQNLWLQRMLLHIQTMLSASSETLDKLPNIVDKVSEVVSVFSPVCATSSVPQAYEKPSIESLTQQIKDLSLQVTVLTCERTSHRHQDTIQVVGDLIPVLVVKIGKVICVIIIDVLMIRHANVQVQHHAHINQKTSELCHSWDGRGLNKHQPLILTRPSDWKKTS